MSHDLFTRATNAQDALDAIHESKNPTDFARRLKGFSDPIICDALALDPGALSTKKDPAKFAAKLSKNVLPHLITRQAGEKWVDDLLDVDKREFARSAALEACSAEKLIQVVKAEGISLPIHATLHLAVGEGRIRLEDLADFVVDGVPGFQTMVRMMQEDMKLDLMCLTEYQDRLVKVARGSECYITQHHAADPRVVKAFPCFRPTRCGNSRTRCWSATRFQFNWRRSSWHGLWNPHLSSARPVPSHITSGTC